MSDVCKLPGSEDVAQWFGYMPNFHDAEVESISLRRSPELSSINIRIWQTSSEVDNEGRYVRQKEAVVTLSLSDIADIELRDWNHQNVLAKLEITSCADGYEVRLKANFGVEGEIIASGAAFSIARP